MQYISCRIYKKVYMLNFNQKMKLIGIKIRHINMEANAQGKV